MPQDPHKDKPTTGTGLLALARTTLTLGGGIGRTLALAINVLRNEGWAGIRWRLSNARNLAGSTDSKPLQPQPGRAAGKPALAELIKLAISPGTTDGRMHSGDYAAWIKRYDTLTDTERTTIRRHALDLPQRPLISVVMPVFDPQPAWLEQAIESVQAQIYDHWELCIADDASRNPEIRRALAHFASNDPRIKVCTRDSNGHISRALNSALELATGPWIAFLDHDDVLADTALFWVAHAINHHPDAGLIYSDEDKINEAGKRLDPHFKPEWNYDLLLSYNFVSHLSAIRRDLIDANGSFRIGYEGAQDHDLILRCTEGLAPSRIIHVPRVLYHWRIHSASTASTLHSKPYAAISGERALRDHFQRRGVAARVEHNRKGYYEVFYEPPSPAPLVSIIIPTRNGLSLLRTCLDSILRNTDYPAYEIIVVDNGSDDYATLEYLQTIQSDPRIRVLRDDRPFNYSALNNAAVRQACGELVALVNNDIEVATPGWLTELATTALQPGVGIVGARLLYPDARIQHAGVIIGLGGIAGHSHKHFFRNHPGYYFRAEVKQSLSALTAACFIVRKSLYMELGGLDEENLAITFNDVDFCLRARAAGYRNVYAPRAELIHHESASRGDEDTPEKQDRFEREQRCMKERWEAVLLKDPAYSPNLTLHHEDFSLAWPPRVPRLP